MPEPMVSLDAFDMPFLRTPDQCVRAWNADAAGSPITAARQRAAMRREAWSHHALALGGAGAAASRRGAKRAAAEWYVFDLPDGPFDYALVRLVFDRRWRRCVWECAARAVGYPNPATAAQAMVRHALARRRREPAPPPARRRGRQRASSGATASASSPATSA